MWYNLKWVLCMEEKIKETINIIKPYLNSDGGDNGKTTEVDNSSNNYKDNIVYVKMHGACAECGYRDDTITDFVLRTIQEEVPEVKNVVNIDL